MTNNPDPVKLLELAERCEKASGPDRELDAQIAAAFHLKQLTYQSPEWIKDPEFTASLDAAMTLVPEGWEWALENTGGDTFGPFVAKFGQLRDIEAKTLPLAICAAALRALVKE